MAIHIVKTFEYGNMAYSSSTLMCYDLSWSNQILFTWTFLQMSPQPQLEPSVMTSTCKRPCHSRAPALRIPPWKQRTHAWLNDSHSPLKDRMSRWIWCAPSARISSSIISQEALLPSWRPWAPAVADTGGDAQSDAADSSQFSIEFSSRHRKQIFLVGVRDFLHY